MCVDSIIAEFGGMAPESEPLSVCMALGQY